MMSRLGWTAYSLVLLGLRPHLFFTRLAELDWYGSMFGAWAAWLNPTPGDTVLEIGCNTGHFVRDFAERGFSVVGVDRSTAAIRRAQTNDTRGNSRYLTGDAHSLPFTYQRFNRVLAASLINLVPEPDRVIAEMCRVTAPEGVVSCLFPTPQMDRKSAHEYIRQNHLIGFSAATLALWAVKSQKLEPADVEQWFQSAHLSNVRYLSLLNGMVCAISGHKYETPQARDRAIGDYVAPSTS
jgi:ubiquinone/menaquinone biosynthesis C-methylase UbiE